MLADRRLARRQPQGQGAQRRMGGIPVLARIAEQPADRPGIVVPLDDEVFAARDEQRVVGRVVDGRVHVEPVGAVAHEAGRVVAFRTHGVAEDPAQVPLLEHIAVGVDFGQDRRDARHPALDRIEPGQHAGLAGHEVAVEVGVLHGGERHAGEGAGQVHAVQHLAQVGDPGQLGLGLLAFVVPGPAAACQQRQRGKADSQQPAPQAGQLPG